VPRAKVTFNGTSPNSKLWPGDPEGAMREIAGRNNAFYIDGSLVFSTNGKHAEALFETVEPEPDSRATKLHQLGVDLDATDVRLYVGSGNWSAGLVQL
jgi:hypothetical protein